MTQMQLPELCQTLARRFASNPHRHEGLAWPDIEARIIASPIAQAALAAMETTGGEPDVIGQDASNGVYLYCDCAAESPSARRSLCYDAQALNARKEHKPEGSALGTAAAMGIELLTEDQYRQLQALGNSISRPPAGSPLPRNCVHWEAHCSRIVDTGASSSITTAHSPITRRAASAACCACSIAGRLRFTGDQPSTLNAVLSERTMRCRSRSSRASARIAPHGAGAVRRRAGRRIP